jgi:hypothetical protein
MTNKEIFGKNKKEELKKWQNRSKEPKQEQTQPLEVKANITKSDYRNKR